MNNINSLPKKVFVLCISLLMALVSGGVNTAQARLMACRADPIVYLSDGSRLVITLDVAASESDVQKVTYAIHAPIGTSVLKVIYTAGGFGKKEAFSFYDDQQPGHYSTDSLVMAGGSKGAAVTAQSKLDNVDSGTATGLVQQHLVVSLLR